VLNFRKFKLILRETGTTSDCLVFSKMLIVSGGIYTIKNIILRSRGCVYDQSRTSAHIFTSAKRICVMFETVESRTLATQLGHVVTIAVHVNH
jgi:hypothetical protein